MSRAARAERILTDERTLSEAVQKYHPEYLARIFAEMVGTFYDPRPFNAMARRAYHLYAEGDPEDAWRFRHRLDERLTAHYYEPVAWDQASRPYIGHRNVRFGGVPGGRSPGGLTKGHLGFRR